MPNISVDAANRLTSLGAQTLSYDANGNLTSDGNQSYVWNARNQLVRIQDAGGSVIASFSYDALGRRQTKTVNGIGSGYLYDGINVVQELAANNVDNSLPGNVRASYIAGGIDENFAQLSGSGTNAKIASYLSDALGSTIQLTDGGGNKLVDYTYDPYGNTTADAIVNNPFQYTGRENDDTGLYYYRARYYSPTLGRFISSDPIGLAGGINQYSYVGGNPLGSTDPTGEFGLVGAGIGAGIDLGIQLLGSGGDIGCVDWTSVGLSAVAGALTGGLADGAFAWKAGSNAWGATRKWLGKNVWDLRKGQEVHHWLIEQRSAIGKMVPDAIKNQPWNLNPMSSNAWHDLLHNLDPITRTLLGAPGWAQGVGVGAGVAAGAATGGNCGCQ